VEESAAEAGKHGAIPRYKKALEFSLITDKFNLKNNDEFINFLWKTSDVFCIVLLY